MLDFFTPNGNNWLNRLLRYQQSDEDAKSGKDKWDLKFFLSLRVWKKKKIILKGVCNGNQEKKRLKKMWILRRKRKKKKRNFSELNWLKIGKKLLEGEKKVQVQND